MRIEQTNGRDIVNEVNDRVWRIFKQSNIPSIRQYMEIFAIKYITNFPNETIEDPNFVKTLLDPNLKANVASSFLIIAGFALTKHLYTTNAVTLKKKIFDNLAGFMTSNYAHARCVAQYFIHILSQDPEFSKQYLYL